MNKKKKITILILTVFTLGFFFLPGIAHGVIGTGFFDVFKAMHAGLDNMVGPYYSLLISAGLIYILGFIFLWFTAFLLEQSLIFTITNLSIEAVIVRAGWNFVVGFANMAIVIALLIAGIALIVKLGDINPQKLITRTIIVALLMNFTLVFVGMMIDISNIFYNTVLVQMLEDKPIGEMVRDMLITGEGMLKIFTLFAGMATKNIVPVLSPFASLGLILTSPWFLIPTVTDYIFQIVLFFALGGIFLMYAIILIARVFIIQILAILSPLAFACLALPQQKKHFDTWLSYMISWLLAGIFFIFFLAIGFQISTELLELREMGGLSIPLPLNIEIDGLMYYIYLSIYFGIVLFLGKKMIPVGASSIISAASSLATSATPLAGQYFQNLRTGSVQKSMQAEQEAKEKAESEGRTFIPGKHVNKIAKWSTRLSGTTYEAEAKRTLDEEATRLEKTYGNDYKTAMEIEKRPENTARFNKPQSKAARALYLSKIKGGKALDEMEDDDIKSAMRNLAVSDPSKIMDIAKHRIDLLTPEMSRLLVDKGIEDKDVQDIIDSGINLGPNNISATELNKQAKEGNKNAIEILLQAAAQKKIMDSLNNNDVKNLTQKTLASDVFQKGALLHKDISFMRAIGENNNRVLREIDNKGKEIMEDVEKSNSSLIRSVTKASAGGIVLPGINQALKTKEETAKAEIKASKDAAEAEIIAKAEEMGKAAAKAERERQIEEKRRRMVN